MKCIICHMEINLDLGDVLEECPNEHPIHQTCLKEWLMHSKNCPLCSTPYQAELIGKFEEFFEQREKEKQTALEEQDMQEMSEKIEKIANNMVFLKFIEFINQFADNNQFEIALERCNAFDENGMTEYQKQTLLFTQGKINLLRERYDLAINQLFKLVKANFDYPDAFHYLGKCYEAIGLDDKARWAFERIQGKK